MCTAFLGTKPIALQLDRRYAPNVQKSHTKHLDSAGMGLDVFFACVLVTIYEGQRLRRWGDSFTGILLKELL